jgi:hypothetical protein
LSCSVKNESHNRFGVVSVFRIVSLFPTGSDR